MLIELKNLENPRMDKCLNKITMQKNSDLRDKIVFILNTSKNKKKKFFFPDNIVKKAYRNPDDEDDEEEE